MQTKTLRTLEETPEFLKQLEAYGDIQYLDEALQGLYWALSNNPEVFPSVPRLNVQVAKTNGYERQGYKIPPLKIWFKVIDENRVMLLALTQKKVMDEESPFYDEDDF